MTKIEMRWRLPSLLTSLLVALPLSLRAAEKPLRPPAVPLVTFNPYLSIWSEADHLTDDVTRHWTHREHPLVSLIRIDGKTFRLLGNEPKNLPAFPQTGVQVLPTRSICEFDDGHVHVTMTFMTPALPHDLDALGRPLSYITWDVRSADGAKHAVSIYDSASSLLTVNSPDQAVRWERQTAGGLTLLSAGTESQPVLQRIGDDTRIDWGHAYLAASSADASAAIGENDVLEKRFAADGKLPEHDDAQMPRAAGEKQPVLAFQFVLGSVGAETVSRHVTLAYDEIWSINYFGRKLRPYWRRNGAQPADLLQGAERDYARLTKACTAFDQELVADLTKVGGRQYAEIASLSYRQCLAACGLAADSAGEPLLFSKENTSNGDIATVDVIFPMEPLFLLLSPTLTKASLVSNLDYSASSHWKFPNAPHDLGTYPLVMGRDDGGEGMPVEESGNLLILCDALAHSEGNANFVAPWWPQLTQWAKYLEQYGLDPAEQLCTDDFMGHLAHNANLSVKAILGLAAYGDLCKMRGDAAGAGKYLELAKSDAAHWMKVAMEADADGKHSRLAFDKPGTWSQKYNLVWDRILGLNIFPPEIAAQEVAYYIKKLQPYGVPLDSRTKLTKTDWSIWTATMAENPADFEKIVFPIYDFLGHTTARSPLMDSYITNEIGSDGMHARPVVGGIFIKMLSDPAIWKKWASVEPAGKHAWAPLPQPPRYTEVVPSSRAAGIDWHYTFTKPAAEWLAPAFDDSQWKVGPGGFGTQGTPGSFVRTVWNTPDIWMRRQFTMPAGEFSNLQLLIHHDEDVEVYINGVRAVAASEFIGDYMPYETSGAGRKAIRAGVNEIAVHCHQTEGGQYVDVGIVDVAESK